MKIKAAVTHGKDEPFRIEEVELAPPQKHEILVKMTACGVCHTDDARPGLRSFPSPCPPCWAMRAAVWWRPVGPEVTEFQVGDKVGLSFGYCGHCHNCMTAHQHACENFNAINFGGVQADGTTRLSTLDGKPLGTFFGQSSFATYAVVNEASAVKVEYDDIDLALVGPMAAASRPARGPSSTACAPSSAPPSRCSAAALWA